MQNDLLLRNVIISDTSCIASLSNIGQINLLELFEKSFFQYENKDRKEQIKYGIRYKQKEIDMFYNNYIQNIGNNNKIKDSDYEMER